MNRPTHFDGARRIVVKIGSAVLRDGAEFDRVTFVSLVRDIVALREADVQVIVVCSGAVALGMARLSLKDRPSSITDLQALASVGQCRLMRAWNDELDHYGHVAAQILLTRDDVDQRRRMLAARRTMLTLLRLGAVPVINENDTIAADEIKLGDNDLLSSQVVSLTESGMLVILSDVDGLYDRPPSQPDALRITHVTQIDDAVLSVAGESTSGLGSGGMRTKVGAVQQVNRLGVPAIIAAGKTPGVLRRLYAGEALGTWFAGDPGHMGHRKHWIAYGPLSLGQLHIDAGASAALVSEGCSLLPIGVVRIEGEFSEGDPVAIFNPAGVEIARGLVSHSAEALAAAIGRQSDEIGGTFTDVSEVIHRDDLVLML
ncbi:MAG: glutamate 5-kinase [Bradymonadia bacterium]|jgi:glutamate 5-kinase